METLGVSPPLHLCLVSKNMLVIAQHLEFTGACRRCILEIGQLGCIDTTVKGASVFAWDPEVLECVVVIRDLDVGYFALTGHRELTTHPETLEPGPVSRPRCTCCSLGNEIRRVDLLW